MEFFTYLARRSLRSLVTAALFGFLSGALNSGLLALVASGLSSWPLISSAIVLAFIALAVAAPLTRVVSELLLVRLGQDVVLSLRTDLSRQVLAVPLKRIEEVGQHRILSALTDDIPNIANVVANIPVLCINLGVVISCLCYMGYLHWKMFLLVLGFISVGVASYQVVFSRAVAAFRQARDFENALQKSYQGLIYGIKELKLHHRRRDDFLTNVLGKTASAVRSRNVAGASIYALAASWGQLLAFVIIGLLIFVVSGMAGVDRKVLTGLSLALLYLINPLQVLMNAIPALVRANIALVNTQQIGLKLKAPDLLEQSQQEFPAAPQTIELVQVCYAYAAPDGSESFTLGPIDLTVRPGELLFITGGNGSGKTTLAKLIVGLYTPDSGDILYNSAPLCDADRDWYRQCFSAVFSDFYVFESLLGIQGECLDDVATQYLKRFRLDHKVRIENGAFSTTELSHGQRKRLALLTCCLEDRPVYFFDEWAADQDPAFKEVFYLSILPALKEQGKCVVVISHDDRYYHVADRLIHLDSGRLSTPNMVSMLSTAT